MHVRIPADRQWVTAGFPLFCGADESLAHLVAQPLDIEAETANKIPSGHCEINPKTY